MALLTDTVILPLHVGDAEQQVAIKQHRSNGVHTDENIEDSLDVLVRLLKELHCVTSVDVLSELTSRRSGVIVVGNATAAEFQKKLHKAGGAIVPRN